MLRLEEIQPSAVVRGIVPNESVTIEKIAWFGSEALEVMFKTADGGVQNQLIYRDDEPTLDLVEVGRPWSFDGDGDKFRLVSEALRIRLAHLFDPVLAVHTSLVDPLPHQITAVYEHMLPRQPLRYLLADDPGAGKTIMAGLLIKELRARGDLERCLIVCPGGLAEQWQDELRQRFGLPFEIVTNDNLEAAGTGNWFSENDLVIARLDKLSRNEEVQDLLKAEGCEWDLVVVDEAHKMSASVFGGETNYTKRYKLGQLLSTVTRHFLLMSATPHNGKEADFQLFMALLDGDRFEGKYRDGVHSNDVSDLMRRMVKEKLLRFDGTPLFPERIAYTLPYRLSPEEEALYKSVTEYVREEFDRAKALENDKKSGTVGFALTILQRRLASSPEAIYQSLRRRKERLESSLRERELIQRAGAAAAEFSVNMQLLDEEEIDNLEDAPESEIEITEEEILDLATAARSIEELKQEIQTLKRLESQALRVRNSGSDTKWTELSGLLGQIFAPAGRQNEVREPEAPYGSGEIPPPKPSDHEKLVIFTEHRDTLSYLERKIRSFLGRDEAVVTIHGGTPRQERLNVQDAFRHDPLVQVLLATDAAGEGINLQRAHFMVNYDLPWNPNRLEQRFGRIHRIGQKEVCYLWNLVADDTREGDVYRRLLEKLEAARSALGGQVFDVLGKLAFESTDAEGNTKIRSLRDLLIEAIRYGELPETKAYLTTVIDSALDQTHFQNLLDTGQLAPESMDSSKIQKIREDMERADARRLQPFYIESFFLQAFKELGGRIKERETRRYEITHVPTTVTRRDRQIGRGETVQPRYERVAFEKDLLDKQGLPSAAFICPGHPLLDSTIDLVLERYRELLKRGTVLVDESDLGTTPRVMLYLEHSVQDASKGRDGKNRTISKRMAYVEIDGKGNKKHIRYAPYLDYRPLKEGEIDLDELLARPDFSWIDASLEQEVSAYAVSTLAREHLTEVKSRKLELIEKTKREVHDRLRKEINYWDHRAEDLAHQEREQRPNSRLNSGEARKRADALQARLRKRLAELEEEANIRSTPPVVQGGVIILPAGMLNLASNGSINPDTTVDRMAVAAQAREIVMEIERMLGFEPVDREFEKLGYDIESKDPVTGQLRFIEVKGRAAGADTITVTQNEVLTSFNKPDSFILAVVEFGEEGGHESYYVRRPFENAGLTRDFNATSVNFPLSNLRAMGATPN